MNLASALHLTLCRLPCRRVVKKPRSKGAKKLLKTLVKASMKLVDLVASVMNLPSNVLQSSFL